ncbi:MAG: hypothetical protein ACXV7J_16750, partial [Methylomonas sp.]
AAEALDAYVFAHAVIWLNVNGTVQRLRYWLLGWILYEGEGVLPTANPEGHSWESLWFIFNVGAMPSSVGLQPGYY